mgnify:CR=1 FL=1
MFELADLVQWQMQLSEAFQHAPFLSSAMYFLAFLALTALCLPGAGALMLVGGGCMGWELCLLLSISASTLGAWLTMLAARHVLRDRIKKRFEKQIAQYSSVLQAHEVKAFLTLRLAPVVPFAVFNLLAGLSNVRNHTFLWTSFVGMLPGTWVYVNAGQHLGQVRSLNDVFSVEVLFSLALLAVLPWLFKFRPLMGTRL